MLSIIGALAVITITACFMVWFVNVLIRSCCGEAAPEETLAITTEYLENILKSREETIQLIQNTDLRLRSFDMLPEKENKNFPPSFFIARNLNTRAKTAYDNYDFASAANYAGYAAKEMQIAQNRINQST